MDGRVGQNYTLSLTITKLNTPETVTVTYLIFFGFNVEILMWTHFPDIGQHPKRPFLDFQISD